MGSSRGVGQHHGNLRAALLEAALGEIADGRAEKLSLRAVARRAGVSAGAPYHHFSDKRALLAAVAREGFSQLVAAQDALAVPDPERHLFAMASTYVRFAAAHATHYRVMFGVRADEVEGPEGEALAQAAQGAFGRLCSAIGAVSPALDAAEVRHRGVLVWSLAHGSVQVIVDGLSGRLAPELSVSELADRVATATVQIARG
ncbi:MAG: TetR/AcrR family transcriptional regulator [Myxococcota bacterium]